jgi:hypothetical protein
MARQASEATVLCPAARNLVRALADTIATNCSIDAKRLRILLDRDALHLCEELEASSGIAPHTREAVQSGGLFFNPSFLTALHYLPPDEALQLFERQDSKLLGHLELFVDGFLAAEEVEHLSSVCSATAANNGKTIPWPQSDTADARHRKISARAYE